MGKKLPTSTSEITGDHLAKQTRGWLLPYLVALDVTPGVGSGRLDYWAKICMTGELPDAPIPRIDWVSSPDSRFPVMPYLGPERGATIPGWIKDLPETPEQHIKRVLSPYVQKGNGWFDDAWLDLVKWLLWGFGDWDEGIQRDVERIPADLRNFWYTQFNLGYLMMVPMDWSSYILQSGPRWMGDGQAKWAKTTAFYSTPMNICSMMVEMTMNTGEDIRAKSVCDPCCGTGSMLLPASNYSLRLYGQDIVWDLCNCAKLNGWLFMPWLVFMPARAEAMFERLNPSSKERLNPSSNERLSPTPAQPEPVNVVEEAEAVIQQTAKQATFPMEMLPPRVELETRPERVEKIRAHRASGFQEPLF